MTEAFMDFRAKDFAVSAMSDHGFENVLASYVRRRSLSIKDIMATWDLSDGEARGVLYAQASRATLRKIIKHKNGGWDLGLMLLTGVIGHGLADHIQRSREHEREQYQARERRLVAMARDIASLDHVGGGGAS